jgi:queuine tRNA-ribosyltransferase
MANWEGLIITDSGGFQAYSLIHNNRNAGTISDHGITFQTANKKKVKLTPEKTIQLQLNFGSDILYCLDDCTHPEAPLEEQEQSVRRTILWAKKCKIEYNKLLAEKKLEQANRPLLFAVIQGGASLRLRQFCSEMLQEIGFDGYGYGGWPVDASGSLLIELLDYVRKTIPNGIPSHALGVGHPENVVQAYKIGWQLFDSSLPTRDARRGRLYAFTDEYSSSTVFDKPGWFDVVYISDEKYTKSTYPIYPGCNCLTCRQYTSAYLHHLRKIEDPLFYRLATIHNLTFMTTLGAKLSDGQFR